MDTLLNKLDSETRKIVLGALYKNQRKYYNKNKVAICEYSRVKRRGDMTDKKFYCVECDKAFYDKTSLTYHLQTKRHKPERYVKYDCPHNNCEYTTRAKSRYTKHLKIKRHRNDLLA